MTAWWRLTWTRWRSSQASRGPALVWLEQQQQQQQLVVGLVALVVATL
jgi:hypothetical protein